MSELRKIGIPSELYPEPGKLKKQFEYAAKRNIPYVTIIGDNEMATGDLTVKNQESGVQEQLKLPALIDMLKN